LPTYEYRCKSCKHPFELALSILDSDKSINCPLCTNPSQKLISRCSFINEGSEHRDIDCIVGADAERKWKNIYERKAKREKNK